MEDEPTTEIEFYVEPDGTVHIHRHAVSEDEVAEVLDNKPETRKEADGSQIALGMTLDGRFLRVVYRAESGKWHNLRDHGFRARSHYETWLAPPTEAQEIMTNDPNNYPQGWDRAKVEEVIAHYENQSDDEAAAEDEAYWSEPGYTIIRVPTKLLPEVQRAIEEFESRRAS